MQDMGRWLNSREGWRSRRGFGLFLCVLLMTFAVANKAAWYHQRQEPVRGLIHTKVWQNNQDVSSVPAPDLQIDFLCAMVVLLVVTVLPKVEGTRDERPAFSTNWFVPTLSVRPPPAY